MKDPDVWAYRHALSIASIPPRPLALEEAAERPENRATIPVAVICRGNTNYKVAN